MRTVGMWTFWCFIVGCGRTEGLGEQVGLLQNELGEAQERIRDLETETNTCVTDKIEQEASLSACEEQRMELMTELECAEQRLGDLPDFKALRMEPTDQLALVLETSLGNIRCELLPYISPNAVRQFVDLVRAEVEWTHPTTQERMKESIYRNTIFHRVDRGALIQGGDPLGTGAGGPGFALADYFECSIPFTQPGILALANVQERPQTSGSQFFITASPQPRLSGRYTVLGVCQSLDVIRAIAAVPTQQMGQYNGPIEPVILRDASIEVIQGDQPSPTPK